MLTLCRHFWFFVFMSTFCWHYFVKLILLTFCKNVDSRQDVGIYFTSKSLSTFCRQNVGCRHFKFFRHFILCRQDLASVGLPHLVVVRTYIYSSRWYQAPIRLRRYWNKENPFSVPLLESRPWILFTFQTPCTRPGPFFDIYPDAAGLGPLLPPCLPVPLRRLDSTLRSSLHDHP